MELVTVISHQVLHALYEVTGLFLLILFGAAAHYWTVYSATK